jgi:hypothetical protein
MAPSNLYQPALSHARVLDAAIRHVNSSDEGMLANTVLQRTIGLPRFARAAARR